MAQGGGELGLLHQTRLLTALRLAGGSPTPSFPVWALEVLYLGQTCVFLPWIVEISISDLWFLSHEPLYGESDFHLAVPQFPQLGLLLVVVVSIKGSDVCGLWCSQLGPLPGKH